MTGARRAPKHDPDHTLASALEYAKHKTGLGYRLWTEFTRDFPRVRDDYGGDELKRYDTRRREIYAMLKHRDGRYMAAFASYMSDDCEVAVRTYRKRRAHDPNARRPRCENPVLRQGAGSCVIYGRGFWCDLSDAPNQPLLASPYVRLRFPITPSRHVMEIQLTPRMVERLAAAVRVGAVTVTDTTVSIAFEPRPVEPMRPRGMIGMDVNKREHVAADTDGHIRRIQNDALAFAQVRRKKHAKLGVTGGKPKKRGRKRAAPGHVKHPGRKPKNKGSRTKKRHDERVNRRERARINTRYKDQKNDWLFKMMHGLAALGLALVLEEKTINRLLVRSNHNMSREERDLLKMGLSQGRVRAVADGVFPKYGLPVVSVIPAGTSSECPACDTKLWAAKYGTRVWNSWRRTKACVPCSYYVDRDDVAAINVVARGVSAYEPAAGPEPSYGGDGRWVAGDWEQCVPQLVRMLLDAAVVWFPYTGEGRRPKGDTKNPPHGMGDARSPDDRPDASNCATGIGPPGETPGALC